MLERIEIADLRLWLWLCCTLQILVHFYGLRICSFTFVHLDQRRVNVDAYKGVRLKVSARGVLFFPLSSSVLRCKHLSRSKVCKHFPTALGFNMCVFIMALRNPANFRTITNCYSTQADGITKTDYYYVKKKKPAVTASIHNGL